MPSGIGMSRTEEDVDSPVVAVNRLLAKTYSLVNPS